MYCHGKTVMYSTFTWGFEDDLCISLLSDAWVLDSRAKYMCGVLLAALIGLTTVLLAPVHRTALAAAAAAASSKSLFRANVLETVLYVLRMTLGFLLMLIVCTYHVPLFGAVVSGIGVGHYFCGRGCAMLRNAQRPVLSKRTHGAHNTLPCS
eukprot:SAG11_NODE_2856_length_2901_cov_3.495717_2_plen_152_part_00